MFNGSHKINRDFRRMLAISALVAVGALVLTWVALPGDEALTGTQRFVVAMGLVLVVLVTALAGAIGRRRLRQRLIAVNAATTQAALIELPRLGRALEADEPEPELDEVALDGEDELTDLAAAVGTLQGAAATAVRDQALASRRARHLVAALSQRQQVLLAEQLDRLSALERHETDPRALRELFALDHLATQMRRDAESLALISRSTTLRRWSTPVAVADVVRAAMSEVSEYRRVELGDVGRGWVTGTAAADLTHLIAELIDNGLSFSPSSHPVEILGEPKGNGHTITIIDHGVGIDPAAMREIERQLRDPATRPPTDQVGIALIARLAATHGIDISLSESTPSGVTARIFLPSVVLAPTLSQPPAAASRLDDAAAPRPPDEPPSPLAVGAPVEVDGHAPLAVRVASPALEAAISARTATGLSVRPRSGQPVAAAAGAVAGAAAGAPAEPEPEAAGRDAAQVRAMLTSFRSGVDRGRTSALSIAGPTNEEDPS